MTSIEEIEARLTNGLTPIPWRVSDAHGLCVVGSDGVMVADLSPETSHGIRWTGTREDAGFIASAPTDIEFLLNELVLTRASAQASGEVMLEVQQDCIAERQRAEKAEAESQILKGFLERYKARLTHLMEENASQVLWAGEAAATRQEIEDLLEAAQDAAQ